MTDDRKKLEEIKEKHNYGGSYYANIQWLIQQLEKAWGENEEMAGRLATAQWDDEDVAWTGAHTEKTEELALLRKLEEAVKSSKECGEYDIPLGILGAFDDWRAFKAKQKESHD